VPEDLECRFDVLGWPPDGPRLRLHYERFSYAGKFVMSNTGKAVAREGEAATDRDFDRPIAERPYDSDVVAAVAFNEDRTDETILWIRYVTVAREHRGNGIGPRLIATVRDAALERGYQQLRIAVNNPYAYDALWKAGFAFTGKTTGLAELVLSHPPLESDDSVYRSGLSHYLERDLSDEERAFVEGRLETGPPSEQW